MVMDSHKKSSQMGAFFLTQFYYFLAEPSSAMTFPPFSVHSVSVAVKIMPVPLQLFIPLQELEAVLQAL